MVIIDCIAKAINRSISYIKAVRGVVGALAAIKRTFSGIHPFNKKLGANKYNNAISTAPP